mgnify:CR=1 FL=1
MLARSAASEGLVQLHEVRAHGASRERLESQGTAARKEIYHSRAGERILENAHPGLPHPVGRGTYPRIPRR